MGWHSPSHLYIKHFVLEYETLGFHGKQLWRCHTTLQDRHDQKNAEPFNICFHTSLLHRECLQIRKYRTHLGMVVKRETMSCGKNMSTEVRLESEFESQLCCQGSSLALSEPQFLHLEVGRVASTSFGCFKIQISLALECLPQDNFSGLVSFLSQSECFQLQRAKLKLAQAKKEIYQISESPGVLPESVISLQQAVIFTSRELNAQPWKNSRLIIKLMIYECLDLQGPM